jgi:hypothetical protein
VANGWRGKQKVARDKEKEGIRWVIRSTRREAIDKRDGMDGEGCHMLGIEARACALLTALHLREHIFLILVINVVKSNECRSTTGRQREQ